MRKPITMKFEEADLQRWDAYAEEQRLSRTSFFETAAERLVSSAKVEDILGGLMEPAESQTPPESQESESDSRHKARPGIRRAFVCLKCREKGQGSRVFLHKDEPADTIPNCAEHGPMVREANKPYKGESTEPLPEQGWPEAKA